MATEVSSPTLSNVSNTSHTHHEPTVISTFSSTTASTCSSLVDKVEGLNPSVSYQSKDLFRDVRDDGHVISNSNPESEQLVQHVVNIEENQLLDINSEPHVQVISGTNVTSVTDSNGAIYLLVSNDSSNSVGQSVESSTNQDGVSVISADTIKNDSDSNNATVQIMNSDGVPVTINVNDLLSTIAGSKSSLISDVSTPNILSLSSSIISTTGTNSNNCQTSNRSISSVQAGKYAFAKPQLSGIPNWALHLRDCTLFGDTYTGYVSNEVEMDAVLNMYKKETQSLFAIRQTPSPAKDETSDTVRLMWKSQYVPYDGIPFVNVGRRATVMECEHGPRKRSNALKRMIQHHGHKNAMKKIPNLTCPARLFVKKVRKFPQYSVPTDADQKLLRQLQEQSLKLVRQAGFHTGEIRLYMQLPLPTAHRYHNVGHSIEAFRKELEDPDELLAESIAVDSRVLNKIQELVRQGFANPFIVRAAVKDFVENKMELIDQEQRPYKHDKAYYPPLIEIQNIIQQTQAALNSGVLAPLPAPAVPPVPARQKRKRTPSMEVTAPLMVKRIRIDQKDYVSTSSSEKTGHQEDGNNSESSIDQSETISLSLTDSQLQNLSVTNFTYDQLAQLAKIGLLALTNAAKDNTSDSAEVQESSNDNENNTEAITAVMTSSDSCTDTLLIRHSNSEEEDGKMKLDILSQNNDVLQENSVLSENSSTVKNS